MPYLKTFIFSSSLLLICSCGGGGGGGGASPSAAVSAPPPPTYIISEGNIFSSSIPSRLFIDENMNGIGDAYEKTTSPNSDGSFSFSTTNSTEVECLKKLPIISDDPLNFSYNPSAGSNINMNAFTTIFFDYQSTYGKKDTNLSRIEADENCSPYEQFLFLFNKMNTESVIAQMEKYDNQFYEQISSNPLNPSSGSVISDQRQKDLEKFYLSLQTIKSSVTSDIRNLLFASSPGLDVTVNTRGELDISNLRIFLNDSGYPNPSTDPSPKANSIDSIAVQAGLDIYLTVPNYAGSYENSFEAVISNIKIDNAGNVLQRKPFSSTDGGCYINFSSLCKVDPTFKNVLAYGGAVIREFLHKKTSRGIESFSSEETITNTSSLACEDKNFIELTETDLSNLSRTYTYREFLGTGTYNPDDISCLVTQSSTSKYLGIDSRFTNGDRDAITLFYNDRTSPGIVNAFPNEIDYYSYSDTNPPPEQIPAAYIDAFLALGEGGWETVNKILSNDIVGNSNSLWADGAVLQYFFCHSTGQCGQVLAFFGIFNTEIICQPIDGELLQENISSRDMLEGNFNTLDLCKEQLTSSYQPIRSVSPLANMSPYRGVIDD